MREPYDLQCAAGQRYRSLGFWHTVTHGCQDQKFKTILQIRLQSQSQRMCERDSSQAQMMVKDEEPSVTLKGIEAMNSELLGEVQVNRVHIVKYREP